VEADVVMFDGSDTLVQPLWEIGWELAKGA
jgi:hypothetical protein